LKEDLVSKELLLNFSCQTVPEWGESLVIRFVIIDLMLALVQPDN